MRSESVVSLDSIDRTRKKQDSVFGRLLKTRHKGGKPVKKDDPFGHYMFCGKQGGSKTTSAIWYMEFLVKKYSKQNKEIHIYSNMGFGEPITKVTLPDILEHITYDPKVINIILVDEIHSWYPKDSKDKVTLQLVDKLTGCFSQLRKRQAYVLSTAQVYRRLNKNLREQCLYMVNCRLSFMNRCVNDFIAGDDVMCDDLGRWAGIPKFIYVHGLPKTEFDTHRLIYS